MTRLLAFIFWVILFQNNAISQKDYLFESLEEACAAHPDSVYRLDLSRNQLKEVPLEILKFKNLRELDLSKNKLTELPNGFVFENLEVLHLTKNKFEVFPTAICSNIALRQLFMGKNHLSELPSCIGELKELIILDVWFNTISILPESLSQLKKLKSFDLRGMNYSDEFQKKWNDLMPWIEIQFDVGCDCGI